MSYKILIKEVNRIARRQLDTLVSVASVAKKIRLDGNEPKEQQTPLGRSEYVCDKVNKMGDESDWESVNDVESKCSSQVLVEMPPGFQPNSQEKIEWQASIESTPAASRASTITSNNWSEDPKPYELELRERQRQGEELTDQEQQDLAFFQEKRDNDLAYEEELILVLESKAAGEEVNEDRLYFLNLLDRRRHGDALNDQELADIDKFLDAEQEAKAKEALTDGELFDKIQKGEVLTDAEQNDLRLFRLDRFEMKVKVEKELKELRERGDVAMSADPLLLFELELFEKRRLTKLSEDELRLIDFLEKRRLGESITSAETSEMQGLLKRLGPKMKDEIYMIDQDDRVYRRYLAKRRDDGEDLDVDEIFELGFLDRAEDDDLFYEKEIEDFETLRETRDERMSDKKQLDELRSLKASGEKIDENLLYKMELLNKQRKRLHLNDKEAFEIDMIRKARKGEPLLPDETTQLEEIRRTRELLQSDKTRLADLLPKLIKSLASSSWMAN